MAQLVFRVRTITDRRTRPLWSDLNLTAIDFYLPISFSTSATSPILTPLGIFLAEKTFCCEHMRSATNGALYHIGTVVSSSGSSSS